MVAVQPGLAHFDRPYQMNGNEWKPAIWRSSGGYSKHEVTFHIIHSLMITTFVYAAS